MGKNRFKKLKPKEGKNLYSPEGVSENFDLEKPAFSFRHMKYQENCCLSKLRKNNVAEVATKLLEISQIPWKEIHCLPKEGNGYEPIPLAQFKRPFPHDIATPEVKKAIVFRYSIRGRIAGLRRKDIFHIIQVGELHDLY